MKSFLLSVLVVATLSIMGLMTVISIANYGNRAENAIKAEYENLHNVLGQYSLKVAEAAQVPDMYRDDVTKVVSAALEGRYGEGGSQAVFQWLREDNSPARLDSALYIKIQQIIESGRDEYKNTQTRFIDTKRVYQTALGTVVKGTVLGMFGYPRIDLDKYNIVTTTNAREALETGIDNGLTIRK